MERIWPLPRDRSDVTSSVGGSLVAFNSTSFPSVSTIPSRIPQRVAVTHFPMCLSLLDPTVVVDPCPPATPPGSGQSSAREP